MTRDELLELLNSKLNSNLWDRILNRLEFFDYEVLEKDVSMLVECLETVQAGIKTQCNIDEIPSDYDLVVAGAVIAEFLSMKRALNQLDISTLDLSTAIASVSMGNTSVSYNSNDSDSAKFDSFIDTLRNKLRSIYPCLRKIHW